MIDREIDRSIEIERDSEGRDEDLVGVGNLAADILDLDHFDD